MATVIPRRLTAAEFRAVKHILEASALALCPGTERHIVLTPDGDFTMRDVNQWPWSHGELELIAAIHFVLGEGRFPDLARVDETNAAVVRGALRRLGEDEAHADARLLSAVEATPAPSRSQAEAMRRWNR